MKQSASTKCKCGHELSNHDQYGCKTIIGWTHRFGNWDFANWCKCPKKLPAVRTRNETVPGPL